MMRFLIIATLFLGLGISVTGQEIPATISTSTDENGARFEIIQPSYDRGTTFRLDRFMGVIHRLGTCPTDDGIASKKCWKEMIVVDHPKMVNTGRPRFQIVIDGPLKLIMLLQVETGQTWQYGIEPTDKWYPFVECNTKTDIACLWRP